MKRRFTRVTAMALAGLVAAGGFTPPLAHAADTATEYHVPYSEFSQEGGASRDSTVTWENLGPGISDDTVVIIPKDIPLGRDTKAAEYGITVKGSIPYDRKVTVTPRDEIDTLDGVNFYMHDTNPLEDLKKADVPATVVQADTEWSVDEVTPEGTVKNGDISAPGLTYGSWEGILTFDINMEATDGSHTHNFVDGNCDKCGMAEDGNNPGGTGNPGTGDGSDGSDGTGGSGDSGETTPPEHTHSYTENITKEPSCTEEGEKTLSCECGDVKTESVPATGHNYVDGICTNCNEKNPDESHEHTYQESISQEGSCFTDRIISYTCECGDSYTENVGRKHAFDDAEFCTGCGQANMDVYTTPGLYGLSDGKPVFRTPYEDIAKVAGSVISTDLVPNSIDYKKNMLYTINHNASLNPYGEKFILYLPDAITQIGRAQFYNYSASADPNGLMCGFIANGLTKIGQEAFGCNRSGSSQYKYFSFSSKLDYIKSDAFNGEMFIEKLYIPSSVTLIGENAFGSVHTLYYSGTATGSSWGATNHIKNW